MASQLGGDHFENGEIKWGRGREKLNSNISGLLEPQNLLYSLLQLKTEERERERLEPS